MPDIQSNPANSISTGRSRRMGVVNILATMVMWGFAAIAIEFLTRYLDLWTQNFARIASAAVFLWAVCLIRSGREFLAQVPRLLVRTAPAFLAFFIYQYLYVRALYMQNVLPGLAYMLLQASVFFTVLLSCILFADERAVVRDRRFQIGAFLSVIGLGGFVVVGLRSDPGGVGGTPLIVGVLILLSSCIFWALYTVLIKLLVRRGSPLATYTCVCTMMALAFGVLTFTVGEPADLIPRGTIGIWVLLVAFGSGILFVGAAHVTYFHAIRALGATVSGTVLLAGTFLTPVLSVIIFGEVLSVWSILSGIILITGSAYALQARPTAPVDAP